MNIKKLHLPSVGIIGLFTGGILRVLSSIFHWPLLLVISSDVILLITVAWIIMFDIFPLFLEPFYFVRERFSRRKSFFAALLLLFILFQVMSVLLPSGPTRDATTTLAFLSFLSAISWMIGVYITGSFTPLIRYMKRKPRDLEKVEFSDVIESMAVIMIPTIALSFFFSPTGLDVSRVTPNQVFLTSLLTDILILAYLYLFVIRPKVFTWKQLGLRKVDREEVGRSLVLFLFVGSLIVIFQALLRRLGVPLAQYSFSSKDGALFAFLVTVGITPFIEELYFRGFLFKGLLLHNKPYVAFLTSAFVFALLHPPLIVMVEVFIIGLLLAYVVRETKSIWPGVLIHMLNNMIVFGYLLYR